jgi:hypothetical protein
MQFLVGGQQSSTDAIRLEEHLTLNHMLIKQCKNKSDVFTARERSRVEELIEGRY